MYFATVFDKFDAFVRETHTSSALIGVIDKNDKLGAWQLKKAANDENGQFVADSKTTNWFAQNCLELYS